LPELLWQSLLQVLSPQAVVLKVSPLKVVLLLLLRLPLVVVVVVVVCLCSPRCQQNQRLVLHQACSTKVQRLMSGQTPQLRCLQTAACVDRHQIQLCLGRVLALLLLLLLLVVVLLLLLLPALHGDKQRVL
jgi:hypothetical protein